MPVLDGHHAVFTGKLRPDRVERDRNGHFCIKFIFLGGYILFCRVALFCKCLIRRPAEEGDALRRGIDGIGRRAGNSLALVHSLLVDRAVAVLVVVIVHGRRPRTAVCVKADQRLLGKGNGGIFHTVAELALDHVVR